MATALGGASRLEEFLATGNVPADVRPLTARSWKRSLAFGLAPDRPLDLRYAGPVDADSALLRAARPVAEQLFTDLEGTDVAMLLTDAESRVLGRWCGNRALASHLERVGSNPGFVFEEARAGTSALGTVLEEGRSVEVMGHEHFAECLRDLSAVGVPVMHPVTGRIEGVVDLVCPADQYSRVMLPLVVRAAAEIGAGLVTGYAGQDRMLLHAYLQGERRGPRRAMFAINVRVLIANPQAADLLGPSSHGSLWDGVERALADGRSECTLFHDEDGRPVEGVITAVRDARDRVGAVVQLRRRSVASEPALEPNPGGADPHLRDQLPGRSTLWQTTVRRSAVAFGAQKRVLLAGASGTGKRALALALAAGPVSEHDADECQDDARAWLAGVASAASGGRAALVLTHIDRLDQPSASRLATLLDRLPDDAAPIIATCSAAGGDAFAPELISQFPHVVELPRLADRPGDIADVAVAIVQQSRRGAVKLEPATVRLLAAADWPGNIRQLRRVIVAAGDACPGTVIRPDDLPEHLRTPPARVGLTRMQRLERETIVTALAAEGGNKLATAESLGISRSTLYRKLEALGL